MLMPQGLKGKAKEQYIKDNAYTFATAPRSDPFRYNGPNGLRSPKVVETKEAKDVSAVKQKGPAKAHERTGKGSVKT